jgi:hypothetical protein
MGAIPMLIVSLGGGRADAVDLASLPFLIGIWAVGLFLGYAGIRLIRDATK